MAKLNNLAYAEAKAILRKSIRLEDYFREHVIRGHYLSDEPRVCCPIHDEDTPSFTYYPTTDTFYCFGCEAGGSIVDFHYHITKAFDDGYTKVKGILDLAKDYKVKIPNLFLDSNADFQGTATFVYKELENVNEEDVKSPYQAILVKAESHLEYIKEVDPKSYRVLCIALDKVVFIGEEVEEVVKDIELTSKRLKKELLLSRKR